MSMFTVIKHDVDIDEIAWKFPQRISGLVPS